MKIQKGHYVPKELITSEAIHEAVVKCFVAAGFSDDRPVFGRQGEYVSSYAGLGIFKDGGICWLTSGSAEELLTLQQLFTADNSLFWPEWSRYIVCNDFSVYFSEDATDGKFEFIHGCTYGKPVVIATRQPKEKEVNEALDKAVIELKGKWPSSDCSYMQSFESEKEYGLNNYNAEGTFCTRDQFTQRAKELGFINGYRYGIEYPTNGKQPDLPDDVYIIGEYDCVPVDCAEPVMAGNASWGHILSFKITDGRYRPKDTSYLNESSQEKSLTHSEEELTHGDWYDYENQKALRLPDVGTECLYLDSVTGKDEIAFIAGTDFFDESAVIWRNSKYGGELYYGYKHDFKPIDHATRKAEIEKNKIIDAAIDAAKIGDDKSVKINPCIEHAIYRLYNAGCLRLPEKK